MISIRELDQVDPDRLADVAVAEIGLDARQWQRKNRRPHTLTAREALELLRFEALLVSVAAANVANGVQLSDSDLSRLLAAAHRIEVIAQEAVR